MPIAEPPLPVNSILRLRCVSIIRFRSHDVHLSMRAFYTKHVWQRKRPYDDRRSVRNNIAVEASSRARRE